MFNRQVGEIAGCPQVVRVPDADHSSPGRRSLFHGEPHAPRRCNQARPISSVRSSGHRRFEFDVDGRLGIDTSIDDRVDIVRLEIADTVSVDAPQTGVDKWFDDVAHVISREADLNENLSGELAKLFGTDELLFGHGLSTAQIVFVCERSRRSLQLFTRTTKVAQPPIWAALLRPLLAFIRPQFSRGRGISVKEISDGCGTMP